MDIANPIYDTVFKYLMEDNAIARLIISTIIKQNVISLDFRPNEHMFESEAGSITVYRLDFSAAIETPQGPKIVIIEIQKAKYAADIMRFRKYLGEKYRNKENVHKIKEIRKQQGKLVEVEKTRPTPILSIYFLGFSLEHFRVPVIRVQRNCYDDATDEKLEGREEFIECLTHDSYVIQVPFLVEPHKTEVEKMLGVFNQKKMTSDFHILSIDEEEFPEKYRSIIRRLQRASAEPSVRDKMDIEDEVIDELRSMSRVVQEKEEELIESEIVIEEMHMELEEQKAALEEKDKALEEMDKSLEDKDREIKENKAALEEKEKLIRDLLKRLEGT
jgi:hypothetical protein